MTTLAYHGTDRLDFTRFDIAEARPFNIGLHFGMRAAALSRIEYLRLNALESELGRARAPREPHIPHLAALQRRFDRLSVRWLAADDNPRYQRDPSLYAAINARMNVSIRRLFQALGYDRSSPSASRFRLQERVGRWSVRRGLLLRSVHKNRVPPCALIGIYGILHKFSSLKRMPL